MPVILGLLDVFAFNMLKNKDLLYHYHSRLNYLYSHPELSQMLNS